MTDWEAKCPWSHFEKLHLKYCSLKCKKDMNTSRKLKLLQSWCLFDQSLFETFVLWNSRLVVSVWNASGVTQQVVYSRHVLTQRLHSSGWFIRFTSSLTTTLIYCAVRICCGLVFLSAWLTSRLHRSSLCVFFRAHRLGSKLKKETMSVFVPETLVNKKWSGFIAVVVMKNNN